MLGAATVAVSASATVYKQGEAFAYTIDPSFTWDLTAEAGEDYTQYPVEALKGQADMQYGFGMTSAWFNAKKFANSAEADEYCPVVADPWDASKFAVRMKTTAWDGFGNFNFALPYVNEPCRIRVIYRVNEQDAENSWYNGEQKPFQIKLMSDGDQDAHNYSEVTELNENFWNNPGWRVADFVETLDKDEYFLSILFDAGGLSCQRNVGFYLEEVSVVPLSKLTGYTAPEGGQGITVSKTFPDLVEFEAAVSGPETYAQGDAFAYDIDPTFTWGLTAEAGEDYTQYPVEALKGQADMQYGFGMTSVWFNGKKFANSAEADEYCPVVADPWDDSKYAVRMKTTAWDGFGNFNFALPYVNEPCRIRVVYRVNEKDAENTWYNGEQKPFQIKLMSDGDQDAHNYSEVTELNENFWNKPGWRIAEFVETLDKDEYFLSILFDAGGLSCQRNVGFYLNEVSVVPVSKLEGYKAPEGGHAITVAETCPDLVKIVRPSDGIENVVAEEAAAEIYGAAGAVVVKDFEGTVEVYNMMGMQVAKVAVNGNATVAAPAGMVIVKAGNTVAKVVVR